MTNQQRISSISFSENKPELRPHTIEESEHGLVLQAQDGKHVLLFERACLPIFQKLNGRKTIREIHFELCEELGHSELRTLVTTLRLLDQNAFLVSPLDDGKSDAHVNKLFRESRLNKPILSFNLRKSMVFLKSRPGLIIISSLIIGFTLLSKYGVLAQISSQNIFAIGDPLMAFPSLMIILFMLNFLASCIAVFASGLASGEIRNLRFDLTPLGPRLSCAESPIYTKSNKTELTFYFLANGLSPLFFGGLLYALSPVHPHSQDFYWVGLGLTFINFHPYRLSSLTQVIRLYLHDSVLQHLVPYLKNRALWSVLSKPGEVPHEKILNLYSVVSMIWLFSFLLCAQTIWVSNLPFWISRLTSQWTIESFSLILVASAISVMFIWLALDIFHTFLRNSIYFRIENVLSGFNKALSYENKNVDRASIKTLIQEIPLFYNLSDETRNQLAQAPVRTYHKKSRIIIQGTPGEELFVILSGRVEVQKRASTGLKSRVVQLEKGSIFGEIALIQDGFRTADVVALEKTSVLVIHRRFFNQILKGELTSTDGQKLHERISLGAVLTSSPVFRELPREAVQAFLSRGVFEEHPSGLEITSQGGSDKAFYILVRGKVDVYRDNKWVSTLDQGDFFGEVALFGNRTRIATVKAKERTLVLRLDADVFWSVIMMNIDVGIYLEAVAELRLAKVA